MRKVVGIMATVAMLVCFAAGCSSSGGSGSGAAGSGAAASGTAAASGKMKPIAKDKIKVGVIHITDPAEGAGYTYTHDVGIQAMQKEIGLEDSQIIRKNNVPDTDPAKIETAIHGCVREACQGISGSILLSWNRI